MLPTQRLFYLFLALLALLQGINGLVPRASANGASKASAKATPKHVQQAPKQGPKQAPQKSGPKQKAVAPPKSVAHHDEKTVTTDIGGTRVTGLLTTVTPANKHTMVLIIVEVSVLWQ